MGIKDTANAALQRAFDGSLSDAIKTFSLVYVTTTYDIVTGNATPVETVIATRGVLDLVNASHIDNEVVLINDVIFTILKVELAGTPEVGDLIRDGSTDYILNIISSDPADVAWSLIGRQV